jgi:hypothetical protein
MYEGLFCVGLAGQPSARNVWQPEFQNEVIEKTLLTQAKMAA